jgi:hypothetical protein
MDMTIQDIPEAVTEPPVDARVFNGIWIEVQIPSEGKKFIHYKSSGPQMYIRVHRGNEVVGSFFQYVYDDGAGRYMDKFIENTLSKCGILYRHHEKVWKYRVTYRDGVPTYKSYDDQLRRTANIRRQQLEQTKQKLNEELDQLTTKRLIVLGRISEVDHQLGVIKKLVQDLV